MTVAETEKRLADLAEFWHGEIEQATVSAQKWIDKGKRVVARYRDERDSVVRKRQFNILWSNVQVLKPALYGRQPKPEVTRRYKDSDPIGRTAALIQERCLEYEVEQYPDFGETMNGVVEDRLLPGRGTAWIRYEPQFTTEPQVSEDVDAQIEHVSYECAPCDYVNWQDFLHNPARTWEEVWWVARRVWLTKAEGVKRFGEVFEQVQCEGQKEGQADKETPKHALKKKAQVWEIWDKTEKQVFWVAKGFAQALDEREDPLQLEGFFPCPKPLYATTTTGSLIPVPDYDEYRDQAEELDTITQRISKLTSALKVVGVYNAEYKALKRLLSEGVENDMIPVDAWAAFAEKGGLLGAVAFLPIKEVAEVLARLFEARDQCKAVIYEVMGIGDIIRGSTDPNETLGAQQLKANFGSMRLRSSQGDVATFATELLRMKAQIQCRHYSPETLKEMSGIEGTPDAQYADQAIQLLKQGQLRDFRISIEADTLAQIDEQQEKQEAGEFLTGVSEFMKSAGEIAAGSPALTRMFGEMLMFAVRRYRVGRTLEGVIENAMTEVAQEMSQPKPPDPKLEADKMKAEAEMAKVQGEQQVAPIKAQAEMAKAQASIITAQTDLQTAQVQATTPQVVQFPERRNG